MAMERTTGLTHGPPVINAVADDARGLRACDQPDYEAARNDHRLRSIPPAAPPLSTPSVGWLLSRFIERAGVTGAVEAVAVALDGLPVAASHRVPPERAEQLAAITCGLVSLSLGAARFLSAGRFAHTMIEMDGAMLIVMAAEQSCCLTVVALPGADVGQIAYEMALLAEQVGHAMTPQPRIPAPKTSQSGGHRAVGLH